MQALNASRPYQITWWKQQGSTAWQELNSFLQLKIYSTDFQLLLQEKLCMHLLVCNMSCIFLSIESNWEAERIGSLEHLVHRFTHCLNQICSRVSAFHTQLEGCLCCHENRPLYCQMTVIVHHNTYLGNYVYFGNYFLWLFYFRLFRHTRLILTWERC